MRLEDNTLALQRECLEAHAEGFAKPDGTD
jgi:hypothetical protein